MTQFLLVLAGLIAAYAVIIGALVLKYRRENRAGKLSLVASVHTLRAVPELERESEPMSARPRLALVK